MYKAGEYDVIVIGTGHSGCEAGLAAARLGCRTLMLTTNLENIALMACNPSIGGPAKGHLVREIDAMGGVMGELADLCQIQMRRLNTGKGPAVQAYRAQIDKRRYQAAMRRRLEQEPLIELRQGMVDRLLFHPDGTRVAGVHLRGGICYEAASVIITAGVYLESALITGSFKRSGGPAGQTAATGLSGQLLARGFRLRRFKTGTPMRLDGRTLDWSKLRRQDGDPEALYFSFLHEAEPIASLPQQPCWQTKTTRAVHDLVRANLDRAPLFNGDIQGTGPRYCPSLEDKVMRFPDREEHPVFIEPEGLDTVEMYAQGLSTSLPEDVQIEMVRAVPGLERARILRPGYAIEYDCLDPTQLHATLETRLCENLFSAGQVNGSSGYEEAAAQGLLAGINAGLRALNRPLIRLRRSEAFIGVLIDDLVHKGTEEPYRLLSGRAEHRLLLRQNNADLRLTPRARELGLVDDRRWRIFQERKARIEREFERLAAVRLEPGLSLDELLVERGSSPLRRTESAADLLKRPQVRYQDLLEYVGRGGQELSPYEQEEVEVRHKYAGYIARQEAEVERLARMEAAALPPDLEYSRLRGISTEGRQALARWRPQNLGEAMRLPGVSPADVSVLMVHLSARERRAG